MRLAPLALLLFIPGQDSTLDQILEKMEARAGSIRDVTFEVSSQPSGSLSDLFGGGYRVRAAFVKGGWGRMEWIAGRESAAFAFGGMPQGEDMEFTFRPTGIGVDIQQPLRGKRAGLGGLWRVSLNYAYDNPRSKKWDPALLPHPESMRFVSECPLYALAFQPRTALRNEPGLTLVDTRVLNGRKVWVLTSARELEDLPGVALGSLSKRIRKTFFVDTETAAVLRLEVAFTGGRGGSDGTFIHEVVASRRLQGGLDFPTRVRTEWKMSEWYGMYSYGVEHKVTSLVEGSSLKPEDVAPAWAEEDLRAEAVLRGENEYSEKDAVGAYSLAVARNGLGRGMMGAERKAPEDDKLLGPLEKAAELKPGAPGVEANLVVLYARSKKEALGPLIDRIAGRERVPPFLAVVTAWAMNGAGRHEDAIKRLRGVEGIDAAIERIVAFLGLKKPKEAAAEFSAAAAKLAGFDEKFKFVAQLEESEVDLTPALADLGALDSRDVAVRALRVRLLAKAKQWDAALDALADAALLAPGFGRVVVDDLLALKDEADSAKHFPKVKTALLAIEQAGDADPRVARVLASWTEKAAPSECEPAYRRAIEKCASTEGDPAELKRRMQLAAELANELTKESRTELAIEASRAFLKHARLNKAIPYMMIFDNDKNPMRTLATEYASKKKYRELFLEIKGIEIPEFIGQYMFQQLLPGVDLDKLVAAGKRELFGAGHFLKRGSKPELEDVLWFARTLLMVQKAEHAVSVLIEARKLFPGEGRVLFPLLEAQAKAGKNRDGVETCDELLKLEAKSEESPRDRVLQRKASFLMAAGDRDKARAALDAIDLAKGPLAPWELWKIAVDYETLGVPKRAVAALMRAVEMDAKPYLKLAQLCEKLEDYENAVRFYRRAIADGYDTSLEPMQTGVVQFAEEPGGDPKKIPQEALRKLMEKLGEDYFIDKFLARTFEPLTEEESKRAKEAIERLQSDKIDERDDAIEVLRKIGPRVAPLLKDVAKSNEEEIRSRVREILNDWALPK